MADSDISEYTYERTLIMEQRNEMLKEMKVSDKRAKKMVSSRSRLLRRGCRRSLSEGSFMCAAPPSTGQ